MKRLAFIVAILCAAPGSAWALGFGAAVGHLEGEQSGASANSRGVFGRLNLIGPLDAEIHVARVDYDDQERSDRQIGVALHLDIFPSGTWAPYLFAGTGIIDVDTAGWSGQLVYDELGIGLAYRLNGAIRLELDYRQGTIAPIPSEDAVPQIIMPAGNRDDYSQVQLGLSVGF
jgi:hypothetical protein